jgi:hypothetical protein
MLSYGSAGAVIPLLGHWQIIEIRIKFCFKPRDVSIQIMANRGCALTHESVGDLRVFKGASVFTQNRKLLCVWFLPVVFLLAVPTWAQITARDHAYALTSPSSTIYGSSQTPHGPTGINGTGFNNRNAFDLASSSAVHEMGVPDNATRNSTSGAIKKKTAEGIADRSPVDNNLPPTLTVSTAALLELHAMRKSAVDLCIELPSKYRTHLPECAEIFKHEIRLQGLAKNHQ